ncbi:MAG: proline racemase family protein [Planctomycetota bacterium]
MHQIDVIDSHTGGEPTRLIFQGGPELGGGSMQQRMQKFASQFDSFRVATVCEPRGSDVLVGGLICQPEHPDSTTGVVFFNNRGFLGMCGHGTIGLLVTLKHLGRVDDGRHRIETPVGTVIATLQSNRVEIQNVESYRYRKSVTVDVPEYGEIVGDVAWGGNWFFLAEASQANASVSLHVAHVDALTRFAKAIRDELARSGITGSDQAYIDHVELFGPPVVPTNDSRNFVLCPGGAYDRSPCGTGTSAKLACLAADDKLEPGQMWRQESILGSVFEAFYHPAEDSRKIVPTIAGYAFVNSESSLLLDPNDPFCMGIPS